MSKHNEHTLKDAINGLLKAYKLDSKLSEKKLINSWSKVMGSMIDKHTKEIYIKNKQLFVQVDSAALRNELSLAKEKIVSLLNREAGAEVITEVIIR